MGYPTVNSCPTLCMQSSNNFEHLQCLLENDRAIWEGRVMQQVPSQFRQACIIKINAIVQSHSALMSGIYRTEANSLSKWTNIASEAMVAMKATTESCIATYQRAGHVSSDAKRAMVDLDRELSHATPPTIDLSRFEARSASVESARQLRTFLGDSKVSSLSDKTSRQELLRRRFSNLKPAGGSSAENTALVSIPDHHRVSKKGSLTDRAYESAVASFNRDVDVIIRPGFNPTSALGRTTKAILVTTQGVMILPNMAISAISPFVVRWVDSACNETPMDRKICNGVSQVVSGVLRKPSVFLDNTSTWVGERLDINPELVHDGLINSATFGVFAAFRGARGLVSKVQAPPKPLVHLNVKPSVYKGENISLTWLKPETPRPDISIGAYNVVPRAKGVELVVDLNGHYVSHYQGDLLNLLENLAIKARSTQAKRLFVTTDFRNPKVVTFCETNLQMRTLVSTSKNGGGVYEFPLDRLFEVAGK